MDGDGATRFPGREFFVSPLSKVSSLEFPNDILGVCVSLPIIDSGRLLGFALLLRGDFFFVLLKCLLKRQSVGFGAVYEIASINFGLSEICPRYGVGFVFENFRDRRNTFAPDDCLKLSVHSLPDNGHNFLVQCDRFVTARINEVKPTLLQSQEMTCFVDESEWRLGSELNRRTRICSPFLPTCKSITYKPSLCNSSIMSNCEYS